MSSPAPLRMTAAEFRARFGGGGVAGVATEPHGTAALPAHAVTPEKKGKSAQPQIRLPKAVLPNKTEAEFMRLAASVWPGCDIRYEPITLRLPSGTRYTPDVVVSSGNQILAVLEIKGAHIHNAASLRAFKEARAAFPEWCFVFAQKGKEGWACVPELAGLVGLTK